MIFLTVGTWYRGFDRLVKAVDELVGSGVITDKVVAQTGYSSYKPKHLTVIDFCSPTEFKDLISSAEMVVSHAGMGTIIEAIKHNKALVVLPRRRAMSEASNDHQFATAKQLEAEGKLLAAYDVSELPDKLKQAEGFIPKKEQGCGGIIRAVQEFIDGLAVEESGR